MAKTLLFDTWGTLVYNYSIGAAALEVELPRHCQE